MALEIDQRFAENVRVSRNPPIAVEGLVDAKEMAKKHPKTFEVPLEAHLKKIKPGDFVKLCRNGERFWVKVTGFEKRRIHGVVANDLIRNDDLPDGTPLYFQKKNIYSWLPADEATF